MKKSELKGMIIEVFSESSGAMDLKDIRKKAKQLGLTIKTSSVSWGYAATLFDTKSNLSTKGNVWKKSPEVDDFLKRVKELKKFVGKNPVELKGEKVSGLQEGTINEVSKMEIGEFYKQVFQSGDELYFYPVSKFKNGNFKGYKFDVTPGNRLKGKPKQISVTKGSINLWRKVDKLDPKIKQKFSPVMIEELSEVSINKGVWLSPSTFANKKLLEAGEFHLKGIVAELKPDSKTLWLMPNKGAKDWKKEIELLKKYFGNIKVNHREMDSVEIKLPQKTDKVELELVLTGKM